MDIILDALIDALKLLPFLFLIYILIEIIEVKYMSSFKTNKMLKGKFAPLLGASVGLVPQCGFSVVATGLFSARAITLGTLFAVYIATSDEAIPILLANPNTISKLIPILSIKFVFALFMGYLIDFILRKKQLKINKECNDNIAVECNPNNVGCCHHNLEEPEEKKFDKYFLHPLIHSLKIFVYILIINLVFGFMLSWIGEDNLGAFLSNGSWWQPFLTGIIGLIPNCATSVIITQLYVFDGINLGSAITGLSVNAGVAIAVLFKSNKNMKENFMIIGVLYFSSVLLGEIITIIEHLI